MGKQVVIEWKAKMLALMRVVRAIDKPLFIDLYNQSTEQQQKEVLGYIQEYRDESVREWIRNHPKLDMFALPRDIFHEICKVYDVANYSRRSRYDCVKEIRAKKKARRAKGAGGIPGCLPSVQGVVQGGDEGVSSVHDLGPSDEDSDRGCSCGFSLPRQVGEPPPRIHPSEADAESGELGDRPQAETLGVVDGNESTGSS